MLLTTSLQTFLHANLTPQLHTLLLLTPNGKLLSSASAAPASLLRTQATIASALYAQYTSTILTPSSTTLSSALPPSSSANYTANSTSTILSQTEQSSKTRSSSTTSLHLLTLQLTNGTLLLRPLSCTLLFVAIGPLASLSSSSRNPSMTNSNLRWDPATLSTSLAAHQHHAISSHAQNLGNELSYLALSAIARGDGGVDAEYQREEGERGEYVNGVASGSGSNAAEAVSEEASTIEGEESAQREDSEALITGATSREVPTASLRIMRRQAEELGKWLDRELEGFVLAGPL